MKNRILYEDNHLIAVLKLPSDIVQGDKTGDIPLGEQVKEYIRIRDEKPGNVFLGVIHRIDRPVSGVVMFAKTSKALSRMNRLFQEKKVQKTYWAVVKNQPAEPQGRLEHYLKKNEIRNKSHASVRNNGGKHAVLDYHLRQTSDRYALLEIHPHTGRHHQIRVQLSAMGCPIKGDVKYGDQRPNKDRSIHLHARKIEFEHPVRKEPICILAPTPHETLWDFFDPK